MTAMTVTPPLAESRVEDAGTGSYEPGYTHAQWHVVELRLIGSESADGQLLSIRLLASVSTCCSFAIVLSPAPCNASVGALKQMQKQVHSWTSCSSGSTLWLTVDQTPSRLPSRDASGEVPICPCVHVHVHFT